MPASKSKDITFEQGVVDHKLSLIEREAKKIRDHMKVTARDIRAGRAEVGSQEGSFTGNKLRADYLLLSADELRLKWVEMMKDKPYFCRIDWHEDGFSPSSFYIGRVGMCKTDDFSPIVVDWRAPISNLYYDGRLGYAEYSAPDGIFKGDLMLKRQLQIDQATVKEVTDIDITTNDNMLQAALSKSADDKLKDIVVTIQSEQNQIIRDKPEGLLIVQGVAGSGKTTILLHRVAYLIYHSEGGKGLKTLIIAPNRLFLNYISNVLPELGVEDIRQETFIGLVTPALPARTRFFPAREATEEEQAIAAFKGSMVFKDILDAYLDALEISMVPEGDLVVGDHTVLTQEEILRIFKRDCQFLPLMKRPKEMEKKLKKRVMALAERAADANNSRTEYILASHRMEGSLSMELAHQLYGDRDAFAYKVEEESQAALKAYMKTWPANDTLSLYLNLLASSKVLANMAEIADPTGIKDPDLFQAIAEHTENILISAKKVTEDDAAALAYLELTLGAPKVSEGFDLVVIDEGQDLSEFQYFVLRKIAMSNSYTIAGDLNQAINTRGVNRWESLGSSVFKGMETRYKTLKKSYRTTVEIMQLANRVISRLGNIAELADPVLRHGEIPTYTVVEGIQPVIKSIAKRLQASLAEGHKSIGIICRSPEQAKQVHTGLNKALKGKEHPEVHLLGDMETEYHAGISVMPAYLAKGLEFDVTMVVDASAYKDSPRDVKLFYVTLTRALHRLHIYSIGETVLMDGVGELADRVE